METAGHQKDTTKKMALNLGAEKVCLQTRKILAFLDAGPSPVVRQRYAPLAKHLEECAQCTREFQHLKNLLLIVERQIPQQAVMAECQENFRREVREIFKKTPLDMAHQPESAVSKFFSNLLGD